MLISGDQPLIRTALGLLVSGGGLHVVDECFNQPEALRRRAAAADVVVMELDLDARRLTRMEKLEQLLAAANGCPVLIVTRSDHPKSLAEAMHKGAAGVVLESRPAELFLRAIRVVLAGGVWVERSTAASVFQVQDDAGRLTRREQEIVELVTQGLQNKTIAERLSITHTTVRHHLTSIFEKLSVANRLELMRYAYDGEHDSDVVRR
ncbi:MAG TPA: response regulator transcription factor [Thermoanaerobaculia bacterium]|nr:response regulator transcription factor [Thermoanaerobaculia bacterium]